MFSLMKVVLSIQATTYAEAKPIDTSSHELLIRSKVQDFFSGWVAEGNVNTTIYPMCSVSGRVAVDPNTMPLSDIFKRFIHNREPELSLDEDAITTLVINVLKGHYPDEMMSRSVVPYAALTAFAIDEISPSDASNVMIWHQMTKDAGFPFKIRPLLKQDGDWTGAGLSFIKTFSRQPYGDRLDKMRSRIGQLPISEQVFLDTGSTRVRRFQDGNGRNLISLGAYLVILEVDQGTHFGAEGRLGTFSKNDVANVEIYNKARLVAVPYPGDRYTGEYSTLSEFTDHDRQHVEKLHYPFQSTVNALLELITVFRQTVGKSMTPEIWGFADFNNLKDLGYLGYDDNNDDFSHTLYGMEYNTRPGCIWGWAIALHMNDHKDRWLREYGLAGEKVRRIEDIWRLVQQSAPFLERRPMLEKIYLLQKLWRTKTSEDDYFYRRRAPDFNEAEIREFFERELPVPQLTLWTNRMPHYRFCRERIIAIS